MIRWKLTVAWVVLQVAFFIAWAASEERRLAPAAGRSILVKTVPVDPRDPLRGQYIRLSYEFSRMTDLKDRGGWPEEGMEVWYVLKKDGEFHVPAYLLANRPKRLRLEEVAVCGRRDGGRILYGVEEYYVPEGTPTPDVRDLTVRLRVSENGGARIEKVYLRGHPWP